MTDLSMLDQRFSKFLGYETIFTRVEFGETPTIFPESFQFLLIKRGI